VDEVELCDDPIPANRITSVQSKYMPLFEAIRANSKKAIKCHPSAVGSVSSGLRKYLERRGEKGKFSIRSVSNYGDGRGRIWLQPVKGPTLPRPATGPTLPRPASML
jgi:hypothetical protein